MKQLEDMIAVNARNEAKSVLDNEMISRDGLSETVRFNKSSLRG